MKTQEALKLALEALEHMYSAAHDVAEPAITAIREALAEQPAQEKAGHTFYDGNGNVVAHLDATAEITMDYSKPSAWAQRKPWVGLTLNEIDEYAYGSLGRQALCCAIEAKLREKNA